MRAAACYWLGFAAFLSIAGIIWSAQHEGEGGRALLFVLNGCGVGLLCALLVGLALALMRTVRPILAESVLTSAALGAATAGFLIARGVRWYRLADEAGAVVTSLALSALVLHLSSRRAAGRFPRLRPLGIGAGVALFVFTTALAISAWFALFGLGEQLPVYARMHLFTFTLLRAGFYAGVASIIYACGALAASLPRQSPHWPAWYCAASALFFVTFFLACTNREEEWSWNFGSPAWLLTLPFLLGLGSLLLPRTVPTRTPAC